jgi:hypothetical protein
MTTFTTMEEFRTERNRLLSASDKLMLPDLPLTSTEKDLVLLYRKTLRDLPSQYDETTVSTAVFPLLSGDKVLKLIS